MLIVITIRPNKITNTLPNFPPRRFIHAWRSDPRYLFNLSPREERGTQAIKTPTRSSAPYSLFRAHRSFLSRRLCASLMTPRDNWSGVAEGATHDFSLPYWSCRPFPFCSPFALFLAHRVEVFSLNAVFRNIQWAEEAWLLFWHESDFGLFTWIFCLEDWDCLEMNEANVWPLRTTITQLDRNVEKILFYVSIYNEQSFYLYLSWNRIYLSF